MIHLALLVVAAGLNQNVQLQAHFVGNAGFSITDGETTLLTDLPYESGSYGYMTYDPARIPTTERTISLITHRHTDHFDPDLFRERDWEIVGPDEVTRNLPQDRVISLDSPTRVGSIAIRPLRTHHRDTEHYSYLVEWNGLKLYLVGDTEDPSQLMEQRGLDYLFITPWMVGILRRRGVTADTRNVIVYHHTINEIDRISCQGCIIPRQGEVINLTLAPNR